MNKPTAAMDCDKHWILFFNTKNGTENDCPYCKLEAAEATITALEAERVELVGYANHKAGCATLIMKHVLAQGMVPAMPDKCTCGLDELLSKQEQE